MQNFTIDIFFFFGVNGTGNASLPKDISSEFGEYSGCFLIKDMKSKEIRVFNKSQCKIAWTPNSTFKILNFLIGLETEVIKDKNTVIKLISTWFKKPKNCSCEKQKYLRA